MFENLSLEELNKVVEEATKRRDEMMATYRKNAKEELRAAWKKFRALNKEEIEWYSEDYKCHECGHYDHVYLDLFNAIDSWLNT